MRRVFVIARGELALLARSRVAIIGLITILLLSVIAAATSTSLMSAEQKSRATHQAQTDALFEAQPARHPHRMVHYGSYVYRPVGGLAGFDPGIDPFSGTTLYLEGHRQNSATISAVRENTSLMRFGQLTPAFVLQVLAPLLMVFLGFGMVTRERARGSLRLLMATGAKVSDIVLGKITALGSVALVALLPAAVALTTISIGNPAEATSAMVILLGYGIYLTIWVVGIICVSSIARTGQSALLSLVAVWSFVAVIAPRGGAELAARLAPLPTRAASDLLIQAELRKLGDSHNPDDPFFAAFKARTLAANGVSKVEDLPFNFRGAVSAEGEAITSKLFDANFEKIAATQRQQAYIASALAIFSPAVAVRQISMAGAGTNLETHLRFLQQGEAHRFAMIQHLNGLHRDALTLADDAARSKDPAAEKRTRVNAVNWAKVPDFAYQPTPTPARVGAMFAPLLILGAWLLGLVWFTRKAITVLKRDPS